MTKVFRYKVYDTTRDDYAISTRMATRAKIKEIGGEVIPGTKAEIDAKHLEDGWTEKGFVGLQAAVQMSRTRSEPEGGTTLA